MITLIDYGVGNMGSVMNMLKKVGVPARVAAGEKDIADAQKIILPGVGAFDTCAGKLQASGWIPMLTEKVMKDKTPLLGVCVGMQLLFEGSEEGNLPGLGWIKGKVIRFREERMNQKLPIPHMGWAEVESLRPTHLLEEMHDHPRFYFVHSYHADPAHQEDILITAFHGYKFTAGINRGNIHGVQFHPEKSHKFGMKLFENFAKKS